MIEELEKRIARVEQNTLELNASIESHFHSLHSRLYQMEQKAKFPTHATTAGGLSAALAAMVYALQQMGVFGG